MASRRSKHWAAAKRAEDRTQDEESRSTRWEHATPPRGRREKHYTPPPELSPRTPKSPGSLQSTPTQRRKSRGRQKRAKSRTPPPGMSSETLRAAGSPKGAASYSRAADRESELRIVLLGKTGPGKSASGNTILGRKKFHEDISFESVTETCHEQQAEVFGRQVTVIDTPGLFDTEKPTNELKSEIEKCVVLSAPGPHVFLLVIRLDTRFTEEERKTVRWIQENFGEGALKYTIVLLTHGDVLKRRPVEDFLQKSDILSKLINDFGGRYHVFNNQSKSRTQVRELLEKIEDMVERNGGGFYTSDMYRSAQTKIREIQEKERKEEERKREEHENKFREERTKREKIEKDLEEVAKKALEEQMRREKAEKEAVEERERKRQAEKEAEEERRQKEQAERKVEEEKMKAELERMEKQANKKQADEERKKKLEAEKEAEKDRKRKREAEDEADEERRKKRMAEREAEDERKRKEEAEREAEKERRIAEQERREKEVVKKKLAKLEAEQEAKEERRKREEAERKVEKERKRRQEAEKLAQGEKLKRERAEREQKKKENEVPSTMQKMAIFGGVVGATVATGGLAAAGVLGGAAAAAVGGVSAVGGATLAMLSRSGGKGNEQVEITEGDEVESEDEHESDLEAYGP